MDRKNRYRLQVSLVTGFVFIFFFFLSSRNTPLKRFSYNRSVEIVAITKALI